MPKRLPWVQTASAQPRTTASMSSGRASVVKSRSGAVSPVGASVGRHDGVADRAPHQVEGVAGRPEAVRQVGGGVDQGPESLGEHAAEGSATDVGCGSTWTGNEPDPAHRAVTPAGADSRPPSSSPHWSSSPWCRRGALGRGTRVGRRVGYGRRRRLLRLSCCPRPGGWSRVRPSTSICAPPAPPCPRPRSGSRCPSTRACRRSRASTSPWTAARLGSPVSSTTSAHPARLAAGRCPAGGVDLAHARGGGERVLRGHHPQTAFTIHLLPASEQCRSFPSGVFPVRVQLVDTSGVHRGRVVHHPSRHHPGPGRHPAPAGGRGPPVQITAGRGPLPLDGRTPRPAVVRPGHPDAGRSRRRHGHGGHDRRPAPDGAR